MREGKYVIRLDFLLFKQLCDKKNRRKTGRKEVKKQKINISERDTSKNIYFLYDLSGCSLNYYERLLIRQMNMNVRFLS